VTGLQVPVLVVAVLVAPVSVSHAQSKPARSHPAPPHRGGAHKPLVCVHTVRSGESLSRIALHYRVARGSLISANGLANPSALRTGQRLAVPGCHAPAPAAGAARPPAPAATDGTVVNRVGPRRVLTELVLGEPDFQGERIPLIWPVEGPVISTFGSRHGGWHAGIDISAEMGTQVLAAAPGTIVYSGWIRAYGLVVKIEHSSGFMTLYAHNLKNLVEAGDEVQAGQVIATAGRSGDATAPHVHFEVRRDGRAYNPLHLLEPSDQSPVFEGDVAASSSAFDHHE
jgi:lipoprotein NlpD